MPFRFMSRAFGAIFISCPLSPLMYICKYGSDKSDKKSFFSTQFFVSKYREREIKFTWHDAQASLTSILFPFPPMLVLFTSLQRHPVWPKLKQDQLKYFIFAPGSSWKWLWWSSSAKYVGVELSKPKFLTK